ncbi:MAG: murein biosynthesis integral membrane protein MurJ, partial [Opitutaceae bacterium]
MSKHLKNIGVVSGLTMVSRVLGLVRESITAAIFGVSPLVSAFFTGQTLPNLFRRLLAEGALTASFVPTLHDELVARQRAGAFGLVNQVASWLLAASTAVVVLAMAVLGQDRLVLAVAGLFHLEAAAQERWLLFAWFAVVLFPYLIFVSLAAAFSAALQTLHRFVEPALSPIWLNVAQISLLLAAMRWAHGDQIIWLCAGVLLGGFLQMVVPAGALVKEGWRPAFDFQLSAPVRSMLRLMAPTVFASSVYLVNMSVSRLVGLSLNDEAVAVLNFAQRLMELPIGVFAVAVSTVVFPLITRYAAAGDHPKLAASYRKGMRLILVINIPAAVGLAVLALPIIRLLFQRGAFDSSATVNMTPVLIANALGLPFFSFVNLA